MITVKECGESLVDIKMLCPDLIIDIDLFGKNIFDYITLSITNLNKRSDKILKLDNINKDRIINDIVFVWTVLGNDFLPPIVSIDFSEDVKDIFHIYAYTLHTNSINSQPNHIVLYGTNKRNLNIN